MDSGTFSVVERLERRLIAWSIVVTLALLILATGIISRAALLGFEREVLPEMGREAGAVGAAVAAQIERAVALGVPADRLVGMQQFLEQVLASRPSLESISFDGPAGATRVQRAGPARQVQEIAIPVTGDAGPIGTLHLGVNPSVLERSAADSRWDIAIVLLVSVLATVEVLLFLADRTIATPLQMVERLALRVAAADWTMRAQNFGIGASGRFLSRLGAAVRRVNERRNHIAWLASEVGRQAPQSAGAAARIVHMLSARLGVAVGTTGTEAVPRSPAVARAPLVLYVFAEQLSTSFVPIFARSLYQPGGLVPEALAVGLPITAFAGMVAVASPWGARLVGRFGARTVLLLGCLPAMLGYLMAAQCGSVAGFALWRGVSAIGYALITMACQGYLVVAGGEARQGRRMAVFVYAAMTGAVCGTAIGAVLADRLGYRATFALSAVLTCGAGLLAWHSMDRQAGRVAAPQADARKAGELRTALLTPGFLALLLFACVPAKLILTGFVFYISPLFLQSLGDTPAEIGRQVMLYGLTMLLTIRLGAFIADRLGMAASSIAGAGIVTGAGLLAFPLCLPAASAVPLAIAAVGLSQGIASAPMLAVVPALCPALVARLGTTRLYGYLRFGERIGSIAGPLLAAALAAAYGFTAATAVFGAISLVATGAYAALAAWGRRR